MSTNLLGVILEERKKRKLINKDFFLQLIWKSLAWIIFGLSLVFLGGLLSKKNYITNDILANIFKKITGKTIDFQKFFLGDNLVDRQNLLIFALVFLGVISFFNTIVALINIFFCSKG